MPVKILLVVVPRINKAFVLVEKHCDSVLLLWAKIKKIKKIKKKLNKKMCEVSSFSPCLF
jgi:hypothetical protein